MVALVNQPLIFFIPGTSCDHSLWSKLWPLLNNLQGAENKYRLVHLTIKSSGSMKEIVAALVLDIQQQALNQPFHLVGFSLGGYLASAVSLKFKAQLKSLIVLANTPKSLPVAELEQRKKISSAIKRKGYKGLNRSRVLDFIDRRESENDELIYSIQRMASAFTQEEVLHHLVTLSDREDLCDLLLESQRPICFCFGESDALVDGARMREMQRHSQHIEVLVVASSGHFLPLEQPQDLAVNILNWLENQSKNVK